jgi:hypothetical protein
MALNVYLTFFKNYDVNDLRRLEKFYFVFSYGTPFVIAIALMIADLVSSQDILGPASVSGPTSIITPIPSFSPPITPLRVPKFFMLTISFI